MNKASTRPSAAELYQAFALLCIAVVPVASFSPAWSVISGTVLLGWRVIIERAGKSVPPPWLRVIIGLGFFALVYANYQTLNGLEAATPLLLVMMALKIVETESKRDLMVLMLLSLFGLAISVLHNQGVLISAYMIIVSPLLLAQLITLSHPSKQLTIRKALNRALTLMLQSLPFAIALFLLFPRLDGPLWGVGEHGKATTGMPQNLSMGDITELAQSPIVAFRAQFHGDNPSLPTLYWRVAVMSVFDGKTWSQGDISELASLSYETAGDEYSYTLTLEPQHNKYVPLLEYPAPSISLRIGTDRATLNSNWQVTAKSNITARQRYTASASTGAKVQPRLGHLEKRRALVFGADKNPQAIAWGGELATKYPDVQARAAAILKHFSDSEFYYSLKPPVLADDPVDEFLFGTKKGFCEHYASSFTLLMRASGVPARVVIGYQGGEYNSESDYWIIRQLDAHAWSEIWLEGEGWVRVDPTFAVAPERVESGIAASVVEPDLLPAVAQRGTSLFRSMRLKWDSLENQWNQLVLGYGEAQQREFLKRLIPALGKAENMVLLLTGIISSGTLLLVCWLAWKNRPLPLTATEKSYRRYIAWLRTKGVVISPADGPHTVAEKVAAMWPAYRSYARAIADGYIAVRYSQSQHDSAAIISQQHKYMRRLKLVD